MQQKLTMIILALTKGNGLSGNCDLAFVLILDH